MNIPFVDLKAQHQSINTQIDRAIQRVLKSYRFIQAQETAFFEEEFANYLGVKQCITVNSGTDALILGMRALELPVGSEVIVPANTFYATALAATENNLKVVFVDVDPTDHGINIEDLERKITPKTKAIVIVHLFGQPDKIDQVKKLIRGNSIYLIEDACQAHGALYKKKRVGNFGIFSAFSFYPTKNLGAYGDGGAIVTNNPTLAKKYRMLREYGQSKKYFHDTMGVNSRLDEMQAAILRVKLKQLDKWIRKRQTIAGWYIELLKDVKGITLPAFFEDRVSVFHLFVILHKKRSALQKYLESKGITTLIHYPVPLPFQKAFSYLGHTKSDFPIATQIANDMLSLPMYPELERIQVEYICKHIADFCNL